MATISKASATWQGPLATGTGTVSASSGIFDGVPVSWAKRAEDRSSGTSPEELLAAAHASCFSMAFSGRLAKAGTPATRLDVTATVTFDKVDGAFKIVSSVLDVRGVVPGSNAEAFRTIADDA